MRKPITEEALAHLAERHGDRWKIWRSNPDGWYACASRRPGVYVVRAEYAGQDLPLTLVEESAEELAEALARADAMMHVPGGRQKAEPS